MPEYMLTTTDNPFNPFTQFDDWKNFDESKGYFTCEYLARIAQSSNELSEEDESFVIDSAMNEIVKMNILGIYRKISNEEPHKGGLRETYPPSASPPS